MSSSYRRERYIASRKRFRESLVKVIFVVVTLLVITVIAAFQYNKALIYENKLANKNTELILIERELSILRTLNPYHVGSNAVLDEAVSKADLYPGWITRVYPLPEKLEETFNMIDVGSFVLNETRFSLASHKSYGIPQPSKSMYRMNGLYPNQEAGRLQIGVEFFLKNEVDRQNKNLSSGICSCYARIDMNHKRVIDKKLHMLTRFESDQVLTGEIELTKGLHPISAIIYCDDRSDFNGDEVEVSISFRNPAQYRLTTSRYSIFHIYNPENITAKL